MIKFNKEKSESYKKSTIEGTGYLAFKDIAKIISDYKINMERVLDLGCGYGRSSEYLLQYSNNLFGTDINNECITHCNLSIRNDQFFLNRKSQKYKYTPYTAIFSILMLFHLENINELRKELRKCYKSLINEGHLIIVSGTKNLYSKNYISVKGIKKPNYSGDKAILKLENIDLLVKDIYWSEKQIINTAIKLGFKKAFIEYPLAEKDLKGYLDEYEIPPYFILILKKTKIKLYEQL